MATLTGKQRHVLDNLERVISRPRKLSVASPSERFDLDGWDCTQQITALTVKKKVARTSGALARVPVEQAAV